MRRFLVFALFAALSLPASAQDDAAKRIQSRFDDAKPGAMREDDWNSLDISSRNDKISVRLNGKLVAEHPGDPNRPKTGPIGLQLHDQFSVVMFRNIRIRER